MPRVSRSKQAQEDLEGIFDYLDRQSSDSSDRFAVMLEQAAELHAHHPHLGASAEAYATNLKLFSVMGYAIFYRPTVEGIEIIRILHGARDIPRLFE